MSSDQFTDQEFLDNIYAAIRALMEDQGKSFAELQSDSGIDVEQYIKEQTNIDISTLKVIAQAFGLTLSGFFHKMETL